MNVGIILATFGIVILHLSEALFPIIVDCCTEVAHQVPRRWLRTVVKFDIQEDGGICKIPAVILHTKRKKLCVSPHNQNVKRWMKRKLNGHQRTGGCHSRRKKKAKRRRKLVKIQ